MHAEPSSLDGNNTDWCRLGGGVGGVQLCRLGRLRLAHFLVRFHLTLGHDGSFGGWTSLARHAQGSEEIWFRRATGWTAAAPVSEQTLAEKMSAISRRIHPDERRNVPAQKRELQQQS